MTYKNPALNLSDFIPWNEKQKMLDSCSMFAENGTVVGCQNGWVYDRTTFGSSAVMDWNLVCENKGYRATSQSVFMLGVLIGSYVFGDLSDRSNYRIG